MSKAIGLMLTICGLILGIWFVQSLLAGPVSGSEYIVAAIAVAMVSVGVRYILKSRPKKP